MSQTMPWAAVEERLAPPSAEGTEFFLYLVCCLASGLLEVALPSLSEAKRTWTLIQLLIRPRGY